MGNLQSVQNPKFLQGLILFAAIISIIPFTIAQASNPSVSQEEDYDYVSSNWEDKKTINFSKYWEGESHWGGPHRVYPVEIDTSNLVEEDILREDCMDIRVASEGELVGSRVVDGTCGTKDTMVYFGNVEEVVQNNQGEGEFGEGMKFGEDEKVGEIEIFYGNEEAGLGKYTTSVYNDDIATLLKPESPIEMYYGHHTYAWVDRGPSLDVNNKQQPKHEYTINFDASCCLDGVSRAYIQDEDGNSGSVSASKDWVATSSDMPSWVEQGETIDVRFRSPRLQGGGYDYSGWISNQWGADPNNPVIQNPSYSTTSATSTSNPAEITGTVSVSIDNSNINDNRLTSCSVTATGQDNGGSTSISSTITDDGEGTSSGTCEFTVQNNDHSNWQPEEELNFDISVDDNYGGSDTYTASGTYSEQFPNSPPENVNVRVDPSDVFSEGVWGGSGGVAMEISATDYESATTNTDLDYTLSGSNVISSSVFSNGQGTINVDWERDSKSDMFGFDRGASYNTNLEARDVVVENSQDTEQFEVMFEPNLTSPNPTGGDAADVLSVNISNPAVENDGSISKSDVEFYADDGMETYKISSSEVSGSQGVANISIEDFDFRNEPPSGEGDWFVKINDTYSFVDYSDSRYDELFGFTPASPPWILSENSNTLPVNESGVGLNPDLSVAVNDPDQHLMNVTFYEGSPGSNRLGEVQVSGGSGIATLPSSQHSLGSNPGDSFEWSIEAEDVEYNKVNQSSGTYSVDIIESPSINIVSPTAGENDVNVTTSLESEITQGDNENVEVNYSVDGGGMNLSHQEVASGTSSGSTVSQSFDLEEGTQYDWEVNASLKDEFGNNIIASDSISFNVADAPSLVDSYPDSKSGLVNPELDVSFDNGNDPVRVEFYDWENEALLDSASGVTGSYSYDTSNSGSFGGEAGQTYFWYVVVEDEATGASYNSSETLGNPWEFSTSDVLDANVNVVQGDRNLNPGSANFGPSEIKVQIGNSKDLDMGEAKFYIEGSQFESISPVPVDETISADITDDVAAEDSQFDWSVEVLEDGNEIGNYSGTFTTHVVSLDWVDESSEEIPARFNLYHSDEDTAFNYGDDNYGLVGNTAKTSVSVALPSLGYGSDDCFRVTAENSAGESSDASPPLGSGGECVGGVIP